MSIDYETVQKIQKLGDDVLVGVAEVAALTGFSVLTVRQRKLPGLEPVPGLSRLRWRLGDLRQWMRSGPAGGLVSARAATEEMSIRPPGRPTKKKQVEARK
ncbi:helix-turn-helix transcriptional regulator [Pseudomonas capeferrum]